MYVLYQSYCHESMKERAPRSGWAAEGILHKDFLVHIDYICLKTFQIFKIQILFSLSFVACSCTSISHQPSWGYQQLSESYVPVWFTATALHYPNGYWCSCWYSDWGKLKAEASLEKLKSLKEKVIVNYFYMLNSCWSYSHIISIKITVSIPKRVFILQV